MSEILQGPDGRDLDRIRLLGLGATGYHGVLPAERRNGQTFGADVVLHVDTRPAARSDDIARTVDYSVLAARVEAVLTGPPVNLVETLAERIADVALALPGVEAVDVVVHKPYAPLPVPFDDVEVAIRRRRPSAGPAAAALAAQAGAGDEAASGDAGPARGKVASSPASPPPDVAGGVLDRQPAGGAAVVLALGGNVGDAAATLRGALADLAATPGITVTGVSPLARTVAVGPEQDDFVNAVVAAVTTLSPRELLAATARVEDAHGRVRERRWGPRTLDIDIVTVDGVRSDDPVLTLPHPRAHERAFVLAPWARLDPAAVLPGPHGGPVAELAAAASDRAGLRWLAVDWRDRPSGTDDPSPDGADPVSTA